MEEKNLIIVGDSAFAEIAYEYFTYDSDYNVVAFSVESEFNHKKKLCGLDVIDFEDLENQYDPFTHYIYVAVVYTGLNRLRARLANAAKVKGYKLASYVSSRAFLWRNVELGEHCFIFEDNTVQPYVKIGNNVVLWSGNHIGHHSVIHDHVFVSSHVVLSGYTDVGGSSFLGVNCTVSNNISIARDCWIGPHVVITKNTEAGQFYKAMQSEPSKITTYRYFKVKDLQT